VDRYEYQIIVPVKDTTSKEWNPGITAAANEMGSQGWRLIQVVPQNWYQHDHVWHGNDVFTVNLIFEGRAET
jgi:hypothetical protein